MNTNRFHIVLTSTIPFSSVIFTTLISYEKYISSYVTTNSFNSVLFKSYNKIKSFNDAKELISNIIDIQRSLWLE